MNKYLFYILFLCSVDLCGQQFKIVGYTLRKGGFLTKGTKMGVKELEFKNQKNKVKYFMFWKRIAISTDVYYDNELFPYYEIAIGNKSTDTIYLKFIDKPTSYGKNKPFVCRKKQTVFLIMDGMYTYELVE